MKISRHALTVLTRQYRSVLLKCALINAGLFLAVAPAMATNIVTTGGRDSTGNTFDSQPIVNVTGLDISDTTGLQAELDAKLNSTTAATTYLTKTDATSTYLTQSNAASTYETQAHAASTYETQAHASSTYETQAHAASTYLTQANATSTYLTQADATSTYLTQANATSTYLTQANATSTYLTKADATSTYATQTALNGKQDTILDLATIRSNATAGAGAATTIATYGDIVTHNASEFQTAITSTDKLDADLVDDTTSTHKFVTASEKTQITTNATAIGTLSSLSTDAQGNLVAAINEVDAHADANAAAIGTLSSLSTDAQSNLVAAINEVDAHADANAAAIEALGDGTGSINVATATVGTLTLKNGSKTTDLSINGEGTVLINNDLDVGSYSLNSQTLNVGTGDQFKVDGSGNIETSGSATVGTLDIGSTGKGFDASGNLTAGTISATGIDTTAANTVKLGGTSFVTDVTGDFTVSGDTTLSGALSAGATTISATGTTAGTPASALAVAAHNTADDKHTTFNVTSDGVSIGGDTSIKGDTTMEGDLILSDGTNSFTLGAAEVDVDMLDGTSTTDAPVLSVDGDFLAEGTLASAEGLSVFKYDSSDGRYKETFDVNGDGAVSAAGGKFQVDDNGTIQDVRGIYVGNGNTDGAPKVGLTVTNSGTDSVLHISDDTVITGTFGAGATGAEFTVGSNGDTTVAGTLTIGGAGAITGTAGTSGNPNTLSMGNNVLDNINSLKVGSSDQFQVSNDGAVTTTSTITADGESKFGKIDSTTYALDVVSGADAAHSTVTANAVIEATQGVRFGVASGTDPETNPVMTSVNHGTAIAAMNTADTATTTGNDVVASAQAVAKTRDAINAELNAQLGNIFTVNADRSLTYKDAALAGNGFETGATTLADELTKYAENVVNATGVSFDTAGTPTTAYVVKTATDTADYSNVTAGTSLKAAIDQLDKNIGLAMTPTTRTTTAFQTSATNTVNQNLSALDAAIGADVTGIDRSASLAGASTATANSVNDNINALDVALGNLTYTDGTINYTNGTGSVTTAIQTINANIGAATTAAKGNIASNNSVNANLDSLDAAIGDRSFATTKYVAPNDDLATAVTKLDTKLYNLDHEVKELRHDMDRGLASVAALSALIPNARGTGNTTLSAGTGYYNGHSSFALGGAHWFTDNLMVNIGAAASLGHTRDMTYRAGISYSF